MAVYGPENLDDEVVTRGDPVDLLVQGPVVADEFKGDDSDGLLLLGGRFHLVGWWVQSMSHNDRTMTYIGYDGQATRCMLTTSGEWPDLSMHW
eukprot:5696729-Amphidinium_carterae.1